FQAALAPILAAGLILTAWNARRGVLFFVGAFPLVNSLPYFFGIAEPLPFAPTSLVLFLFVFLGYLLGGTEKERTGALPGRLKTPLLAWTLLVIVSATITALRYADFFPFRGRRFYELTVNVYGVRAGGALMSVVLTSLTYLTGLAFFWMLSRTLKERRDAAAAVFALGTGAGAAFVFALAQRIGLPALGANPTTVLLGLSNGTFTDAMALGAFASVAFPLFLGTALTASPGWKKAGAVFVALASLTSVLFSGSKVALPAVLISVVGFAALGTGFAGLRSGSQEGRRRRRTTAGKALLIVAVLAGGAAVASDPIWRALNGPKLMERFRDTKRMVEWRVRAQWLPALRMAGAFPLTGVGIGAFVIEAPNVSGLYTAAGRDPESAENLVLQIVAETGLAGGLAGLWLLWALAASLRSGPPGRPGPSEARARFPALGAGCGLLAFAVDAQMHTYLGSPEVHYLAWLSVGLLFVVSDGPSDLAAAGTARRRSSRLLTGAAVAAVLAYGSLHLWNSGRVLSLPVRTRALGLARDFGLYPTEREPDGSPFRWTRGYGGIPLIVRKSVVVVRLRASHPDLGVRPLRVRFYWVEGVFRRCRLIREISIADSDWRTVELTAEGSVGSERVLLIETDRTWNPKKALGVPDPRDLGVALGPIEFRDAVEAETPSSR
ncbi:MAG: hypothetical protein JW742_09450, partial [Candidatus Aminicenantes bacterium]|nr:hypothetical protein [Candidatus Aminicenantes bacterium]